MLSTFVGALMPPISICSSCNRTTRTRTLLEMTTTTTITKRRSIVCIHSISSVTSSYNSRCENNNNNNKRKARTTTRNETFGTTTKTPTPPLDSQQLQQEKEEEQQQQPYLRMNGKRTLGLKYSDLKYPLHRHPIDVAIQQQQQQQPNILKSIDLDSNNNNRLLSNDSKRHNNNNSHHHPTLVYYNVPTHNNNNNNVILHHNHNKQQQQQQPQSSDPCYSIPLSICDVTLRHEQLPFGYFFDVHLPEQLLYDSLQHTLQKYYPICGGSTQSPSSLSTTIATSLTTPFLNINDFDSTSYCAIYCNPLTDTIRLSYQNYGHRIPPTIIRPLPYAPLPITMMEWRSINQNHSHRANNNHSSHCKDNHKNLASTSTTSSRHHPTLLPIFDPLFTNQHHYEYDAKETPTASPSSSFPLLTVRVTYFADSSTCLGINFSHLLGDTYSCIQFVTQWGETMRQLQQEEELQLKQSNVPTYRTKPSTSSLLTDHDAIVSSSSCYPKTLSTTNHHSLVIEKQKDHHRNLDEIISKSSSSVVSVSSFNRAVVTTSGMMTPDVADLMGLIQDDPTHQHHSFFFNSISVSILKISSSFVSSSLLFLSSLDSWNFLQKMRTTKIVYKDDDKNENRDTDKIQESATTMENNINNNTKTEQGQSNWIPHEYVPLQFSPEVVHAMKVYGMESCKMNQNRSNNPSNNNNNTDEIEKSKQYSSFPYHNDDDDDNQHHSVTYVSTNDMITAAGWLYKRTISNQYDSNLSVVLNIRNHIPYVRDDDHPSHPNHAKYNNNDNNKYQQDMMTLPTTIHQTDTAPTTSTLFGNGITNVIATMKSTRYVTMNHTGYAARSIRQSLIRGIQDLPNRLYESQTGFLHGEQPHQQQPQQHHNLFSTTSWGEFFMLENQIRKSPLNTTNSTTTRTTTTQNRSLGPIRFTNDTGTNALVGFHGQPSHPLPPGRSYTSVIHRYPFFGGSTTGLEEFRNNDDGGGVDDDDKVANSNNVDVDAVVTNKRGYRYELLLPTEEIPHVQALHHQLCQDFCDWHKQKVATDTVSAVVDDRVEGNITV